MNYKVACDLYRSRYNRQAFKRKEPVPKLTDKEILLELSIVQKELSETYRLASQTQTLDLILNQYQYVVGTGASNIKADILDIDSIFMNPSSTTGVADKPVFLHKASLQDIGNILKLSGQPKRYAYVDGDADSVLWLDTLPAGYSSDSTSRLFINYNQRMFLFYNTQTNANTTWSDYDETSATYGGSFKIPNQFHSLIVEGALANAFPELTELYLLKVKEMVRSKPQSVSGKLQYSFGGLIPTKPTDFTYNN